MSGSTLGDQLQLRSLKHIYKQESRQPTSFRGQQFVSLTAESTRFAPVGSAKINSSITSCWG